MTSLAVEWVSLATPEFVAWTRLAGVRLPFPLNTSAQPFVPAPAPDDIRQLLAQRKLSDSATLAAARAVFIDPRLCLYAVRVDPAGRETKYAALTGMGADAVLVQLDPAQTSIRQIAETELAAAIVAGLPRVAPAPVPPVEITVRDAREIDAVIASGASQRTVYQHMERAGVPARLVAFREHNERFAVPSGVLGAVVSSADGSARHAPRAAGWREYPDGGLLQIERPGAKVLLCAYTHDAVFQAAVDAIASGYEARQ